MEIVVDGRLLQEAVAVDDVDEENRHLARLGVCTHTPYLARHCQRNMIGSPPRGVPVVVDYR